MNQATPFRHDDIFVGFGPIDELHREFQMLLDRLVECEDADYGQHLLELEARIHAFARCQRFLSPEHSRIRLHGALHFQPQIGSRDRAIGMAGGVKARQRLVHLGAVHVTGAFLGVHDLARADGGIHLGIQSL